MSRSTLTHAALGDTKPLDLRTVIEPHWLLGRCRPKRVGWTGGLRFGALVWLSAWPATALANVMRVRGGGAALPLWVDVAAVGLALGGGALALWLVARSRP